MVSTETTQTTQTIELTDIETNSAAFTFASDPFSLSSAIKSPAEIEEIATSNTHSRLPFSGRGRSVAEAAAGSPPGSSDGKKRDIKGLQSFYESQNAHIQRMLKSVDTHRQEAKDEQGDTRIRFLIAVHGSFAANILLAVLQLYAAISSGSLSLFATAADSVFDPLSNLLLILSHRAVNRVDPSRFPSGKARLETAGNIGFSFLMIAVSLILIAMSLRDLATGSHDETKDFNLASVIAVGARECVECGMNRPDDIKDLIR